MNKKIRKSSAKFNDHILETITHDQRSAFNVINSLAFLLNENYHKMTDEDIHESLEMIFYSSISLQESLGTFLRWLRFEKENFELSLENVNIAGSIGRIVRNFRDYAASKQISTDIFAEGEISLFNDKGIIEFVLKNIIFNAIKFNPRGGSVKIRILNDDKKVTISVKDTGFGIADNDIGKLFCEDRSVYREGSAGEYGAGIGLMLCKKMLSEIDGTINVASQINFGSEFRVVLPI